MKYFLAALLLASATGLSQPLTPAQKKALNNYVHCGSRSASEINSVIKSLQYYYHTFYRVEYVVPRFTCPVQPDDTDFDLAVKESSSLPASVAGPLNEKLSALQSDMSKIHLACQALETYHKLQDFKRDDLAKADKLINDLQLLVKRYHANQASLWDALTAAWDAKGQTDELMREAIRNEYNFLDKWSVNLNEGVHTGWPYDQLKESISQTEASLAKLKSASPDPGAAAKFESFEEGLHDVLAIKQHALNNYNADARRSDKLSNDVYFDLMNNLNGALISDYNAVTNGLHAIHYAPVFEIRKTAATVNLAINRFEDIQHIPVTLARQKTALTKNAFTALNQYISFINETALPVEILSKKVENFSSTAATYKALKSFARRDQLSFDVGNFRIPHAEYTQTMSLSSALPATVGKSLNAQATVLLNILKELEQTIIAMQRETSTRNYEKDNLDRIYLILERQNELLLTWDERKEQLYDDARAVFDAFPPASPTSSWYKSGQAMQRIADATHKALFEAKAMYKINDVSKGIVTSAIDTLVRQAIAEEFINMKGIARLGGANGNDPYTPYEKLPQISAVLSEKLAALKPANARPPGFNHPYNEQVHLYNVGVTSLNKFSELSKSVFILKAVYQPALFKLAYPEKAAVPPVPPAVAGEEQSSETSTPTPIITSGAPETSGGTAIQQSPEVLRLRDTIVIERHDTIYIRETDTNLRSMEGYAVNNLVLLIDASGSMNTPDKFPLLKQSLLSMLSIMRPEDEVSIVAYSEKAKVLLQPTSFRNEERVKKVISRLTPSGKTNGDAGLRLAYKVADENYIRGGNNRIILATDGEFPVTEELLDLISDNAKQDILLTVFNFGAQDKTRLNLQQLSKSGHGRFTEIRKETAELDLIREVKAKRAN